MHVYTFYYTDNVACNIKSGSDICVSVDKKHHLKLRSCYATWVTSAIEKVKVSNYMVCVYTTNSRYSIMCENTMEAHSLAEAILDHIG